LFAALSAQAKGKILKTVTLAHAANFSAESRAEISPLNSAYSDAAKMAVGEYEKRFADLGIEIRVLNFDHGPTDAQAAAVAADIVKSPAVGAVGFYESGKALLAAPILVKAGVPLVSPTASAVKLTEMGPLVRTLAVSNRQMAVQMTKIAVDRLRAKHALVVTESDCAYCMDLKSELKVALAEAGVTAKNIDVPSNEKPDEKNMDEVLKTALGERFDVVILPDNETMAARVIQSLLKAGMKAPFVGGDSWGNGETNGFYELVKDPELVAYAIGPWHPDRANPHGKIFNRQWIERFYRNPTNDFAMVYEGTHFLLHVMYELARRKTPITRATLARQIAATKEYDGMVSKFVFRAPGAAPSRSIVILKANPKKKRFDPLEAVWVP
jgi:branched-chain amino acid transport system substrate-binding protein